ncbi:TlpA family protein disulfide reductase [Saccharicrinis sp. 156]|uniref:TlpA family protein disulfide reductase n=1 Tax=Saccharicrinis sp. 156 TaxID=3417574 RepID=UPI003D328D82
MKIIIFSLGLALSLVACIKKAPDYAVFTGKIDNLDIKEITLAKADRSFSKKIAVDPNGTFADTIKADPGLYLLTAGKNRSSVYLYNGSAVNITADAKDFNASLNVSGKGAAATNYMIFKNKKTAELKGEGMDVYKLEEADFKNKFKEINKTLNAKLDTAQGITPAFKSLEKRNLNYDYLLELSRYAGGYHRQWAKKRGYKASEEFLAELKEIDLNNDIDFYFSSAYKKLVHRHYNEEIKQLIKKESIDYGLVKVTVYSTIPNQTIKNELIFSGAENQIYNTEKFEDFYNIFMGASTNEENNAKITEIYNQLIKLNKGQRSPKFVDYENNAGGTLSLDDLKGKYIFIDVWATWCGPCVAELPYLKRLEKEYSGKNISFLSISMDDQKDHDKWTKMIADKGLGGIQVLADSAFKSQFIQDYEIRSIPRFILIDPEGLIVTQHAPRPSSPEIIDLFNSLNI